MLGPGRARGCSATQRGRPAAEVVERPAQASRPGAAPPGPRGLRRRRLVAEVSPADRAGLGRGRGLDPRRSLATGGLPPPAPQRRAPSSGRSPGRAGGAAREGAGADPGCLGRREASPGVLRTREAAPAPACP